ncbi:MAG: hypothetical protein J7M13_04600 [Synergistetes bacterium]|nr:hypothetical protein [Synergistota bacterium]
MDSVSGIVASKLALEQMKFMTQVQANLFKQQMDLQKELMNILLQSMGIGGNVNLTA